MAQATCASPRASRCKRDRPGGTSGRDLRFNGVAKGRQQPGERQRLTSVAARPATLEFRETAIDAPAYAAAGSASSVGGGDALSAIRTDWSWPASPAPAARQPGPPAVLWPGHPCRWRCAARQRPSDASRVSIGTLDLRDTSTQLTFDNTRPYNIATGQGVQISQLLFGGGNTLTITGKRRLARAASACLDPMPPIRARPCQPGAAS